MPKKKQPKGNLSRAYKARNLKISSDLILVEFFGSDRRSLERSES